MSVPMKKVGKYTRYQRSQPQPLYSNQENYKAEDRKRGTLYQVYDRYLALARDANTTGDRVAEENYLQHAEHYFRMLCEENHAKKNPLLFTQKKSVLETKNIG